MDIKAVAFDVGETLVFYNKLLNWQSLYSSALERVMAACGIEPSAETDEFAQKILTKYNTRVNPREHEISSDTIFSEILSGWKIGLHNLGAAKRAFYGYFQSDAGCYDDVEDTLLTLKNRGIKTGVLTDVPYGMDNEYALADLASIEEYIDVCFTSNDIGCRKPNVAGFLALKKSLGVKNGQIVYVGNEQKDIIGANAAGFISVLIERDGEGNNWGQRFTVRCLSEMLGIFQ